VFCNHLNPYICAHKLKEMMPVLFITIIILTISVFLLSIKVVFKKNGRFPNTHVSGSKALRDRGITCIKSQDIEMNKHKNLKERMSEIKQ